MESPLHLSSGEEGRNIESGDDGSMFSQNFNNSAVNFQSQSSGRAGTGSMHSLDSGNVTQNIRKIDRIEADAACDHELVEIKDRDGRVVKMKMKTQKMTRPQTFFALCKSYCAINVLLTPKAFANGGLLLSPAAIMVASFLQATAAIKLT